MSAERASAERVGQRERVSAQRSGRRLTISIDHGTPTERRQKHSTRAHHRLSDPGEQLGELGFLPPCESGTRDVIATRRCVVFGGQ